ncbi:MAG: hypothetical protein JWM27_4961 [Gemmatimonadetes bacterium]|nr:hypothetical protein [Gemmatimonadota bacterium]
MTRLSYDSIFSAPVWITPHTNWQGSYDSGEVFSSDNGPTCKKVSSGVRDLTQTGEPTPPNGGEGTSASAPPTPDSVTVCLQVDWPAPHGAGEFLRPAAHAGRSARVNDKAPEP